MPKKSSGCYRCRRRKVKCDEAQPSCQRCRNIARPCPGYRTEQDVEFRDQTLHYSRKVQQDGRSALQQKPHSAKNSCSTGSCTDLTSPRDDPKICVLARGQSRMEHRQNIILRFLGFYLPQESLSQTFPDIAYFLLFENQSEPQYQALFALALTCLGIHSGDTNIQEEAKIECVAALEAIWRDLPSAETDKDCMLAAINLLAECEELNTEHQFKQESLTHVRGARDYLLCWYQESGSETAKTLYYATMLKLIWAHLLSRTPVEFEPAAWVQENDGNQFHQLLLLLIRVPTILSQFYQAFANDDPGLEDILHATFEAALQMRARFEEWFADWQFLEVRSASVQAATSMLQSFNLDCSPTADTTAYNFTSYRHALTVVLYSIGMASLNSLLADIMERRAVVSVKEPTYHRSIRNLRAEMQSYVVVICRVLPYLTAQETCGYIGRVTARRAAHIVCAWFPDTELDDQLV